MRRDVFQAIADPTRREIIDLLVNNPLTPTEIAKHFDSSRQAVSKHIRILDECELLKPQQQGREIVYHCNPKKLKELDKWLQPYRAQWEKRFNQLDQILNHKQKRKP